MRQFAESEIVLPSGPHEGSRFRCDRQPYSGLYFDAVDSGRWSRINAAGCVQSGKTITCCAIPTLYHLFEVGEAVIFGLPSLDLARDKWVEDLLPAIEHTRYRDLMPRVGGGSKGGTPGLIRFENGASLRFMTGGGGDKSRAGYTARVLVVTESDGMDESGGRSREADKITQLEARLLAFGSRARAYFECTVSIEDGFTWQTHTSGTASRIFLACPHCHAHVHPGRKHLVGWQEASDEETARAQAAFACPDCGELWTEQDRRRAHDGAVLVHRGQEIQPHGTIVGDLPRTRTLGFRWDAVNNFLRAAGDLGVDEWLGAQSANTENAEKKLRQFVWTLPSMPDVTDIVDLEVGAITRQTFDPGRGIVPGGSQFLAMAIDIGKYLMHWTLMTHPGRHIVAYGEHLVPSRDMTTERAVAVALDELRDMVEEGWPGQGDTWRPDVVFVDSGWQTDVVYDFCRETPGWHPVKGRGFGQDGPKGYATPKTTGTVVKQTGTGWHMAKFPAQKISVIEIDADLWKSRVHEALAADPSDPLAITLHAAPPNEHAQFARHILAESQKEEFVRGRGIVTRWVRESRQNHYLDTTYMALAAGDYLLNRPQTVNAVQPRKWFSRGGVR